MDIKLKNYSHSIVTKVLVFIIVIVCFTGAVIELVNAVKSQQGELDIAFEDNYYLGDEYLRENQKAIESLTQLIRKYRSEEYILKGGTVTKEDMDRAEKALFLQFQHESIHYDHRLSNAENYAKFKETYSEQIAKIKDNIINEDLNRYNHYLRMLKEIEGLIYYAQDGEATITNTANSSKDYFKSFPSYMIFDPGEKTVYPKEIQNHRNYSWMTSSLNQPGNSRIAIYISYPEEVLNVKIKTWLQNKEVVKSSWLKLSGFLFGLLISFICLVLITGRRSFFDRSVHLNSLDRLYTDINLVMCILLIGLWIEMMESIGFGNKFWIAQFVTAAIAAVGLSLVLSLVKHFKNRTLLRHSLIYSALYKVFKFVKDIYDSGSVGVKIVIAVIVYPALVAATFFIFPVTIGAAAWLALKRVKDFNAIKEGVERIRNGEIHHSISVTGNGEMGRLAANINGIAEGLNKAVDARLKSERLKTELITNVSHDIRTPLTSIITYVDLLKNEKDLSKASEYIEIIEQKAQRLRMLTDDLFEASKASSGNIPVNLERIDVVSLITQGLGELNDKVEASELDFKLNHPKDKVFIKADGKLLWRALENLFSNLFKYALKGSRVYIDIQALGDEAVITIKNISAYELNVSAEELMERFKRGDESRSSQGSGLGLSIAKSLVDIQNGNFHIEVDGDLFKAIIRIPTDLS